MSLAPQFIQASYVISRALSWLTQKMSTIALTSSYYEAWIERRSRASPRAWHRESINQRLELLFFLNILLKALFFFFQLVHQKVTMFFDKREKNIRDTSQSYLKVQIQVRHCSCYEKPACPESPRLPESPT